LARYIGYIAAAGKAVNPLPLYVNAALRDPISHPSASTYESGGATDNVIPIWKRQAPAMTYGTDIYYAVKRKKALRVIELYDRPDNRCSFRIGSSDEYTRYFYSFLWHGGIGFHHLGLMNNGQAPE